MRQRRYPGIVLGIVVFMIIVFGVSQSSFAGWSWRSKEPKCNTKYPIVLVHGLGWKDFSFLVEYFYKIPKTLNKNGARAYSANNLSMGGHGQSAASLAVVIAEILAETNSDKVNIIGQSQGGPVVRYLLEHETIPMADGSTPFAYEKVASYTSIGAPNKGTPICDFIIGLFPEAGFPHKILMGVLDVATGIIWGERGETDSARAFIETSTKYMTEVFNVETPIVDDSNGGYHNGVFNQSYMGKLTGVTISAILFLPTQMIIRAYEGPNTDTDGFVSIESAKFGVCQPLLEGTWWNGGVDHGFEINQPFGLTPGFNAKAFYIDLVEDLKDMGF